MTDSCCRTLLVREGERDHDCDVSDDLNPWTSRRPTRKIDEMPVMPLYNTYLLMGVYL